LGPSSVTQKDENTTEKDERKLTWGGDVKKKKNHRKKAATIPEVGRGIKGEGKIDHGGKW